MNKKNLTVKGPQSKSQILINGMVFDSFGDYLNSLSVPGLNDLNLPSSTILSTTLPSSGSVQDWFVSHINKKFEDKASHPIESSILEKDQYRSIMKAIGRLSSQLKEHDEETKIRLDSLIIENVELKDMLSNKYSAKSLLFYSVTASLSLLMSLTVWFQFGIIIIHPAIAGIALIGTIGFSALSAWRIKKHG